MIRVKRGYTAQRHRTKIHSFASNFRGARSRPMRTLTQHKIKASVSAHRDRDRQKRDFRRLWISRINAAIRGSWIYCSYSRFMKNLYKNKLLLNRKILAQIAILNRECLYTIFNEIIKSKKKEERNGWISSFFFNFFSRKINGVPDSGIPPGSWY
uniref:Large ribosomal subunit protein bL20c n=2 Tax=Polygala TaxID=4275 RepID=A0A7T7D6C7_9FABA|nr:ribosomal protein L20 [Polygala japonica]YP_010143260.1 ribosomal protein L20 [Polygala sibirica]QNQ64789.1 ribosomal protein L20 [Polygala japonica]QQL04466.1 ribosomal protein L20 [Polygala sibirica]WDR47171.1 ribosomal protein L20 [Polygala sibirica]WRK84139.1 ribosomal protein L20 [Polygala sibirica]